MKQSNILSFILDYESRIKSLDYRGRGARGGVFFTSPASFPLFLKEDPKRGGEIKKKHLV